jgi:hypothetical protein
LSGTFVTAAKLTPSPATDGPADVSVTLGSLDAPPFAGRRTSEIEASARATATCLRAVIALDGGERSRRIALHSK